LALPSPSPSEHRFEGATLDEALARARAAHGADARVVAANHVRRGGVGGFFARESVEVIVHAPERDAIVPRSAAMRPAPPARPERPSVAVPGIIDLAERMNAVEQAVHEPVRTPPVDFESVLARVTTHAPTAGSAPPGSQEIPSREPNVARPRRAGGRERVVAPGAALAALGVPDRYIPVGLPPDVVNGQRRALLAESFAALPVPPALPAARGVVVAVTALDGDAVALARALLAELELPEDALVVASPEDAPGIPAWLHVDGASAAEERRRSWRRRDRPTVVALPDSDREARPFARVVLDALEPTVVWGTVDARRKPEDVVAWSSEIGGVDVLALRGCDDTVSPAALLSTGIPVGRIDDAPATSARWAELLETLLP
jgi:hypothetical protein